MLNINSRGLLWGLLGVVSFSFTLPATKFALESFSPSFVAIGRVAIAGILALIYLLIKKEKFLARKDLLSLILVALGVVVGFPLFTSLAMQTASAAHGAVIIGLLPLGTLLVTVLRTNERPSVMFWLASLVGSLAIIFYILGFPPSFQFSNSDLYLVLAVICAATGYAEGGKLSIHYGGSRVICWALVLCLPFALPLAILNLAQGLPELSPNSIFGYLYVSVVSQLLGFFSFYKGMALAGVSRIGQLQLLQPIFTFIFSAALLSETIGLSMWISAVVVLFCVAIGKNEKVRVSKKTG